MCGYYDHGNGKRGGAPCGCSNPRRRKPSMIERRIAAREQMDAIGDILGDRASAQAARVCRAAARKALDNWVRTGRMYA